MQDRQLPETPEQWQEVVDQAQALLQLESAAAARHSDLLTIQRYRNLLRRGRRLGYRPSPPNVARLVVSVAGSRALLAEMDLAGPGRIQSGLKGNTKYRADKS
jgi:hypothetical protein